MKQNIRLRELVAIRSGMIVPKTANNDATLLTDAFVKMISTSDFDEEGNLREELEDNVLMKPSIERNFLQPNEILFNAKGRRFFAALYKGEHLHTIASASFLVLTPENDDVFPDFLVWYLNHPETLKIFNSKMTSQTMPSITKQELGELNVMVPAREMQRQIVRLDKLKRKQINIQKQLIELEEKYIDTIMYKKLKNEQ